MGAVWESEDETLHRRVAVKVLSDALAAQPEARERFGREARAAARLHHPGIASVFDFGQDEDLPFIVMEFVEGKTLADLSKGKPMDPSQAARVGSEVAAALDAAHQEGIVHRDVKPSNVMLTPSGRVKVMDFGIAVAGWLPSVTTENALVGTPTYTSPEQAAGKKATPASDVYSLGVLLYELLAGAPPFTGNAPIAVASAHATAAPPPLPGTVPETLAATVAETLAKNPADRPSATELERTLDGGSGADAPPFTAVLPVAGDATIPLTAASPTPAPPSSDPPSPSRAAAGSKRRSRLVAAGLAAILVAALIFAVATAGGGPETAAQGQPSPASDSVKVPDLVDMDRRSAKQTLVDNGLEMGSRIVTDGNDVVVATEPPAGSTLTKGSEVDLVLAAADEPTSPPPETPTEEPKPEKEPKEPKEPKPEKDNSGEGSSDSGQGDDEFFVPPGQETDFSGSSD